MRILYTEEFKTKCFNYLRHFMDIRLLMSAIDNRRDNVVRYYLENALDDPVAKYVLFNVVIVPSTLPVVGTPTSPCGFVASSKSNIPCPCVFSL